MKPNVKYADRIVRMAVAMVFVVLYFGHIVSPVLGLVLLISGIIFLATSFTGFCPIYWMLGIRGLKQTK